MLATVAPITPSEAARVRSAARARLRTNPRYGADRLSRDLLKSLRGVRLAGEPEKARSDIARLYYGILSVVAAVGEELLEHARVVREDVMELRALVGR